MCVYHQFCGKGVALEHDGNLYSCDHYVYPEYKLGNIQGTSSSRMVFSDQQKKFGFDKFNSLGHLYHLNAEEEPENVD